MPQAFTAACHWPLASHSRSQVPDWLPHDWDADEPAAVSAHPASAAHAGAVHVPCAGCHTPTPEQDRDSVPVQPAPCTVAQLTLAVVPGGVCPQLAPADVSGAQSAYKHASTAACHTPAAEHSRVWLPVCPTAHGCVAVMPGGVWSQPAAAAQSANVGAGVGDGEGS